jgi:hypothetical protein
MATVTPNFNWPVPTSTDLVKDGATAIEALGDSIDASLVDLKGGTTGQVLSKNSNTDMDFTWVTDAAGDITGVTAGTGISGGGTSGTVTVTNSMATAIDAKGDLVPGTGADTFARLAVGANGTILTADSAETTGLKWATPAASISGLTLIKTQTVGSAVSTVTVTDAFSTTYDNYVIQIANVDASANGNEFYLTFGGTTANYYASFYLDRATAGTSLTVRVSNGAYTIIGITGDNNDTSSTIYVRSPFLAARTTINGLHQADQFSGWFGGQLADTTSYTAFTVRPSGGTITGGTIKVYGYQNS